jgi:hypothetical protein
LIAEVGASALGLSKSEENYYALLDQGGEAEFDPEELICIGAALEGGFENTQELHVEKYKEAIKGPDKQKWENAVFEEHKRLVKNQVWRAVPKKDVPRNAKVMSSTWAMKKKSNRTYRERSNARGYEQVDGIHYDSSTISSPVTNYSTIRIIMVLMIIFNWSAQLVDVKGAFLFGNFKDGEEIFMEVLEGFEEFYGAYVLLLLLQTIYGLKQAAMAFLRELVKALTDMKFKRSSAEPCLYYCCTMYGLVVWLSWIDDCLVAGDKRAVEAAKEQMKS